MRSYDFKVILKLSEPIPDPHSSEAEWFPLLANIYGSPSKSFDGYVSGVDYSENILNIKCYLVEDNDNYEKLSLLKQRYSDWNGYQQVSIIDAVKIHSRLLGYNLNSISIVST